MKYSSDDIYDHPSGQSPKNKLSGNLVWKTLLPVVLGIGVAIWLFARDFQPGQLRGVTFGWRVIGFIALAWLCMVGRDLGLTWRFRILTDRRLTWLQALRVNMLCEFTSCVTPTAVGGSTFSLLYLSLEGIKAGRATTLMMTTLLLDELFLVVCAPIAFVIVPGSEIFGFGAKAFVVGIRTTFWVVYGLICLWTLILFTGIFIKPEAVRALLSRLFRLPFLRRWSDRIDTLGADMVTTGIELRHKSTGWWLKAFGVTVVSWLSRFLTVNALFLAFAPMASQAVVLMRQFVVWIVLMAVPTPGGSGVSEWLFTTYYGDLIPAGMALVVAMFWRVITYYIYLFIGVCIIPGWLHANYKRLRKKHQKTDNL